ncbi:MAG: hypothetical protein GX471_01150 [Candidatus Microthrix parvicella]|nr:hypothetical protein [Candidatus Microthrix parvicella]
MALRASRTSGSIVVGGAVLVVLDGGVVVDVVVEEVVVDGRVVDGGVVDGGFVVDVVVVVVVPGSENVIGVKVSWSALTAPDPA